MEDVQVELHAAKTILQRGLEIPIKAPLLLRIFGKRTVKLKLYQPTSGTMSRVAVEYLKTGISKKHLDDITPEQALLLLANHGISIHRAVATAILGGYISGFLFTRILAFYLRENLLEEEISGIMDTLIAYGGLSHFMNTTRSVRLMKMKMMMPMMGHENQGS